MHWTRDGLALAPNRRSWLGWVGLGNCYCGENLSEERLFVIDLTELKVKVSGGQKGYLR